MFIFLLQQMLATGFHGAELGIYIFSIFQVGVFLSSITNIRRWSRALSHRKIYPQNIHTHQNRCQQQRMHNWLIQITYKYQEIEEPVLYSRTIYKYTRRPALRIHILKFYRSHNIWGLTVNRKLTLMWAAGSGTVWIMSFNRPTCLPEAQIPRQLHNQRNKSHMIIF